MFFKNKIHNYYSIEQKRQKNALEHQLKYGLKKMKSAYKGLITLEKTAS